MCHFPTLATPLWLPSVGLVDGSTPATLLLFDSLTPAPGLPLSGGLSHGRDSGANLWLWLDAVVPLFIPSHPGFSVYE